MNFKSTSFPFVLFVLLLFVGLSACAQKDKSKRKSPPATASATVGGTQITVDYSQPSVNGREIWGALVPYNKVWRTGANEATTIEFSKGVTIAGNTLQAGKYALFTIPGEKEWTIIFNKQAEQWGAYKYKEDQDALRIKATPKSNSMTERMTFEVSDMGDHAEVALLWEKVRVAFLVHTKE